MIGLARRRIRQAVEERVARRGLSSRQFWTLVALRELDAPSLQALAARQRMDAPTASRVISDLARRGLVRVDRDPKDRRRVRLVLTAKGDALAKQTIPIAAEIRRSVVHGFSDGDQELLRGLLRRVISNVESRLLSPRSRRR